MPREERKEKKVEKKVKKTKEQTEEIKEEKEEEKGKEGKKEENIEEKLKEFEEKTKEGIFTKFDFVFVAKLFIFLFLILLLLVLTKNINFPSFQIPQQEQKYWWNSSFPFRVELRVSKPSNFTYIILNFSKYSNITKWNGIRFVGKEVYEWFNSSPFFTSCYLQPINISFDKKINGLVLLQIPASKLCGFDWKKLQIRTKNYTLAWWNATPFLNSTFIFLNLPYSTPNITISWNETQVKEKKNVFQFFTNFSLNRVYWVSPSSVTFEKRKIINPNISIINNSIIISSSLKEQYEFAGISTRIPIKPSFLTCVNFQVLNSSSYDHAFEIVFSNQTQNLDGCFVGAYINFFSSIPSLTTQYGCGSDRNEKILVNINPFKPSTLCLKVNQKNYTIILFDENFSKIINKTINFSFNNYGQIAFGSANGVWVNINQKIKVNWFFVDNKNFSQENIKNIKVYGVSKIVPNEKVELFVKNKGETKFYIYFSNLSLPTFKNFTAPKNFLNCTFGKLETYASK
ncbi:MAG: hypothetical protein ACPLXS_02305 [Candidatus Micrarchaeales archaeon]